MSWPFASTYAGMSFGVGAFRFNVPQGIDQQGNAQSLTVNAAVLAPRLDFGLGFYDWIGLQISASGAVASGSNIDSALNLGALFRAEFGGRLIGRIWRGRMLQIGAAFGGSYAIGKSISPLGVVTELLNSGTLNASTILRDVNEWTIFPELMVAFAPISLVGLQSSFTFRFGKTSVAGSDATTSKEIVWGVGATLDLRRYVPIALPLVYQLTAALGAESGSDSTAHLLESGVVYSGRRNLDLGVLLATQLQSEQKQYTAVFRMYYHW
ncbi:MAG: hypothetical protein KC503_28160 [Myxococcales bacterium]|nr:hypothetical protein [Myxococcales bacterium]